VYDLHGRELAPWVGTVVPAAGHVSWHAREVFKGQALTA
jgi:putative restriction endonuclease